MNFCLKESEIMREGFLVSATKSHFSMERETKMMIKYFIIIKLLSSLASGHF